MIFFFESGTHLSGEIEEVGVSGSFLGGGAHDNVFF